MKNFTQRTITPTPQTRFSVSSNKMLIRKSKYKVSNKILKLWFDKNLLNPEKSKNNNQDQVIERQFTSVKNIGIISNKRS